MKFTETSDPIHDMEIGKPKQPLTYGRPTTDSDMHNLYKKWYELTNVIKDGEDMLKDVSDPNSKNHPSNNDFWSESATRKLKRQINKDKKELTDITLKIEEYREWRRWDSLCAS